MVQNKTHLHSKPFHNTFHLKCRVSTESGIHFFHDELIRQISNFRCKLLVPFAGFFAVKGSRRHIDRNHFPTVVRKDIVFIIISTRTLLPLAMENELESTAPVKSSEIIVRFFINLPSPIFLRLSKVKNNFSVVAR